MNDRENDNRIKDEGRQVQQELEDQLPQPCLYGLP